MSNTTRAQHKQKKDKENKKKETRNEEGIGGAPEEVTKEKGGSRGATGREIEGSE